jgi:hypothetical protein
MLVLHEMGNYLRHLPSKLFHVGGGIITIYKGRSRAAETRSVVLSGRGHSGNLMLIAGSGGPRGQLFAIPALVAT